ncbi:MAG: DoxX family membrane protein [Gammaproteobacteria bacterium]|nr:DoxX family membrane protein [Gammaproteobacteria bacterium]
MTSAHSTDCSASRCAASRSAQARAYIFSKGLPAWLAYATIVGEITGGALLLLGLVVSIAVALPGDGPYALAPERRRQA